MRTEESDLPSIYTNLSKMAPDNKNIQYLNIIVFSYNSPKSPPDKGDPGLNRQKKNPENLLISLLLSLCTFETKGTRRRRRGEAPPPKPATGSLSTPPTSPTPPRSIRRASGLRDVILIELSNYLVFGFSLFSTVGRRYEAI